MATLEFKLPDIGEGVHEGEIVRWIVPEGGTVKEDDPIVEVMTDKATVEIPAPQAGTVTKHMFGEGDVAEVGQVIFVLDGSGASAPGPASSSSAPAAAESSAGKPAGNGGAPKSSAPATPAKSAPAGSGSAPAPAKPATAPAAGATGTAVAEPPDPGRKVLAAPATRRLARELGVNLGAVRGSGPNGRVKPEDVRAAAQAPVAPAGAAPPKTVPARAGTGAREVERIPFRGIRKITAEAMTRSKYTAVHFSLIEEVDVTELKAVRARAKEKGAEYGVNVTYMPYIMKAVAIGLGEFPQLNAMLDEAANEIVQFKYVDLGIAVDTDRGLMVPVVEDVQHKGVLQLSAEMADLAERARGGKIKPEELKGSTFSITNAGNIGGVFATPILNFPNVAIVGVHAIRRLPRVLPDDSIVPRDIMWLSISIDHRLVDGADGARFMVRVRELLEDPGLMLL